MKVNNYVNCNRLGFISGKTAFNKTILTIFFGIVFGIALCCALITQFYCYQAFVAGILCLPLIAVFFTYSPRKTLLSLLVLTIPFNPSFHVLRDNSLAFPAAWMFWTSDLIVILMFVYFLIASGLQNSQMKRRNNLLWKLGVPLLLWIVAGAISIVPAGNNTLAIIELTRMIRIFLIFAAVFFLVEGAKDIRLLAVCLVAALAIQFVLVLAEYGLDYPLFRLPGEAREADIAGEILRPGGTMGHSNNFAKLAALCLPICLAFIFVVRKNIWRICVGLILVGGLVSLVLTVSRAGFTTSIFGLFWISLLILTKMRRKAVKILVPLIFLFIGIGLAWTIGGHRFISRVKWDYGSAISRPQMFSVAWNVIKTHPFIGVGLNNYTLVAPDYDRTPEKISIRFPHPVHDIYMLHASEIGIPGALCFIWFLVATIAMAFKYSSETRFLLDSTLAKAIGIGITCSWLQGLIGWGHRSSIVHLSYLAVLAGAFSALRYYNQNRSVGHVSGR